MSERTLVLIKPDGVARGLVGEVLGRIERKGFRIVALELRTLTVEVAEEHYGEHKDKPFFADLVDFITGGPLVAAVIEGPDAIVSVARHDGRHQPGQRRPRAPSAATSPPRCRTTSRTARTPRSRPPARSRCSSPAWPGHEAGRARSGRRCRRRRRRRGRLARPDAGAVARTRSARLPVRARRPGRHGRGRQGGRRRRRSCEAPPGAGPDPSRP